MKCNHLVVHLLNHVHHFIRSFDLLLFSFQDVGLGHDLILLLHVTLSVGVLSSERALGCLVLAIHQACKGVVAEVINDLFSHAHTFDALRVLSRMYI